jgi:hypothetical protein
MSAVLAEQGSAMWIQQRVGCLTASRISDAFAKLKSGEWAKSRHDYQMELVAERLTGLASDHYISKEMLFGIENEDGGVAAYEWKHDCIVEHAGFLQHPTIPNAGASPDRFVGRNLLEVKAPKSLTFVELRLEKQHGLIVKHSTNPDDGYLAQCMWQLACKPDADWCDLVYYDPRMPPGLELYERRIERNDKIIGAMEDEARVFLAEVDALEAKLRVAV